MAACRPDNRVRYEMLRAAGLLRHRVERAFQRIRALVHQGDRPDLIERFNIPLDEYPRRCEVQIAALGSR